MKIYGNTCDDVISQKYLNYVVPVAIVIGLPFYIYFSYHDKNVRAVLSFLSAGAIFITFATLRSLASRLSFWLIFVISVVIHALLVYFIDEIDGRFPVILLSPFVIIDIIIWQSITIAVTRPQAP